jgi:hypothetical protein
MADLLLGKTMDGQSVQLDPKALTTHGFVLGMTGSGKTGLCVVLVEELLRAGVPVIAVDSKGDLGTLLLSFDPGDAASLGRWVPNAATEQQRVTQALAALPMTPEAFSAFRASYEPRLYTPGASLGLPLDLLGSLAPPASRSPAELAQAADTVVRALLALLDVEVDPLTSREYLLLTQVFVTAWQQGVTPSLADLVRQVNTPPFTTLGVLPLDDFYPPKERAQLMVRLNGLLASPKFAAWREGEPLDPGTLLRAPDGRPRLSVYSVAHLSDAERIFAVAQLLERTTGWMKKQGGGGALRGVILLDEIYGYFPPAPANPATKPPLLGLLKQARAFGVSVVLATQNPIDLDYRGLANIGTWLVGRLQTEQDKARIRDALTAAAASTGVTGAQLDGLLATLQPRRFLLHSVHRPQPAVFASRDTLTVLHPPFSEDELRTLAAPKRTPTAAPAPAPVTTLIDPELGPLYEVDQGEGLPFLVLKFGVRYRLRAATSEETVHELGFPLAGALSMAELLEGEPYALRGVQFQPTCPAGMTLQPMPAWVSGAKAARVAAAVKARLPAKLDTKLLLDPQTRLISGPTESLEAFTARVAQRQGLSKEAAKLLQKLERKQLDATQVEQEVTARKAEKWLTVGAGVMSLFGGRRSSITSVGRAMSSQRMQGGAEAKLQDLQVEIQQLQAQLTGLREIDTHRFEEQVCVPKDADVQVLRMSLAWIVP